MSLASSGYMPQGLAAVAAAGGHDIGPHLQEQSDWDPD